MRFHHALEAILGKKSNIAIVRVLISTSAELTGRQIAQLSGLNHRTCQLSLAELADEGLVRFKRVGRSSLYALNQENALISQGVVPLFHVERRLISDLAKTISHELRSIPIVSMILFGSVAMGDESPSSDIDICIVVENKRAVRAMLKKEDLLAGVVSARFGNPLTLYVVTTHELVSRYRSEDPLTVDIVEQGRVLAGQDVQKVIQRG